MLSHEEMWKQRWGVEGDSGRDMEERQWVWACVERLWRKRKGRNRGVCLWREGKCVREIWVCVWKKDMVGCVCVCIETGMGLGVDRVGCVWRRDMCT